MAALLGGPQGGGMWFRTLEKQVDSRWDLLIYLAWYRLRHPSADGEDEEDNDRIRQQQAEAIALLHR